MRFAASLRVGAALGVLVTCAAGSVAACAAIVGVEDVRLRSSRDAGGDVGEEEERDGDPPPDAEPPPPENVLNVALGLVHTCARKPAGAVKCWGDDTRGQTGTGGMLADAGVLATPTAVAVEDALAIAAGNNHTCAVRAGGKVSCWGDNVDGQLGNGQSNARSNVPVDVIGLTDAKAIACGANFSCALRRGGTVACWGGGLAGQLGSGSMSSSTTPVAVGGVADVVAISAGEAHACAVNGDGKLFCWGDNQNGQLGTGSLTPGQIASATAVPSVADVAQVAAAQRSTCARTRSGAVSCWGANELGQLGSGAANPTPNPSPTAVSNVTASYLWAGANHACAIKRGGGAIVCWGAGAKGQLGDGQPRTEATSATPTPVPVSGITNAIAVGTGGDHSCAPASTGTIQCWGDNARGQLGNGTQGMERSPESVLGYP